ncbi:MAG: hypothetical protein IKU34_12160 [Clostridia bacterium]|nr:hypothetical protein [Clostridia bacterium]
MARLPGLLAADLTEKTRLHPLSGSLTVKMTGSGEADMTLPEDAPAVNIHDLISIYTDKGPAGIYRVTNVAQNYKKQIDVTLLHAIDILSDSVWAAQTTFEGTRTQYITALLNQQTVLINGVKPWVLGTCQDTETVKQDINYDRLSTLMEALEEDGGSYYFTYDFSTWPWTVNYLEKPNNAVCEFRLARNVRTATTTYNDADLCTRLYLAVNTEKTENDVTTTVTTIRTYDNSEAQGTWGIVTKTADIDTKDDPENNSFDEADAWAAAFLARRREPTVQIQIDGDELKAITGDTWDEYSVGKKCQVALPDYAQAFVERVVSVSYPDLYKDPGHVTVSLANNLPKFSENLTDARKQADDAKKKALSAGRGSAKAKDLTTWSAIVTYQGQALDGTGVMTLWQSGIDMDAQGGVRIFSLQEGLQALYAGIEVTASQIRAEVSQGLSGMHSEIVMTASQIKAEVDNSLSGIAMFVMEADQIRAEVQDALSNLGTLIVESSQIRAEVQDALSNIAQFEVTASQIRQEVADNVNSLRASITVTASQIRQEVSDENNSLRSLISVTASQIRQEVSDEGNSLRSSITVTASQIRQEVSDEANSLRASITTTANGIRADVEDNLNDVRAAIEVTASQIRQEVTDSANDLSASITLTSSQIRQEVSDEANSLRSSITTTANRIALVVDGNGVKGSVIVDAINNQSTATITADKILLSGNTTVAGMFSVSDGALYVSQDAVFRGNVSVLNGGTLAAPSLQLFGSGTYVDLTPANTKDLITELQITSSGNVYTLQKKTVNSPDTWTDVANFNRGSAAVISGAWSGATYTASASGSTPVTTTVGLAGSGNGQSNFTVSAYHDGNTNSVVKSEYIYLTENVNSTRVEAHWGSSTGIVYGQASTLATYTKGKNDVTLSEAWSGTTYTVTASNSKTKSTTVGLLPSGNGSSNFSVNAYHDTTANTITSGGVYLTEDTGNKRVEARWGSATGTVYAQVSTAATYTAGADAVTLSKASSGNLLKVTASNGKYLNSYINLQPQGNGADNFSISAYYGTFGTDTTLITRNVYLEEDTDNKAVKAHWNTSGGTVYAQVSTQATYNAGSSAVTLSRAISGNRITVNASNGKSSNTYVNLTPSGNGQDNFTVSAYYGTDTANTLISRYVYLVEQASSKRVVARWNGANGTIYGQVSTQATYDAGAAAVTLSAAWNSNKYTVTSSNNKTKSTTIGLTADGNGTASFTVAAYHDSTSSTVKSEYIYLVDNSSQHRVEARWASSTGTVYGQCAYSQTSHSISVSSVSAQPGSASISGRTNAKSGGISRPAANSYIFFTVSCGGTSKNYYIPINT